MHDAKRWTVVLDIERLDAGTRAVAHLHRRESDAMTGVGTEYRSLERHTVPDRAAKAAVARALAALGQELARLADGQLAENEPAGRETRARRSTSRPSSELHVEDTSSVPAFSPLAGDPHDRSQLW